MSILALGHQRVKGWGWGLLNGVVTLVLGLLILTMSPAGLLSVLGLLVGISFLFSGFDLLGFSSRLHGPSTPTDAGTSATTIGSYPTPGT